jgi:hypothetical protein
LMNSEPDRVRYGSFAKSGEVTQSYEVFIAKWLQILEEAAALKGSNNLLHCSEVEKDYIQFIRQQLYPPKGNNHPALKGMSPTKGVMKELSKLFDLMKR